MLKTLLPFPQIPQLSKTDVAYATGDERLDPFYRYEPRLEAFGEVMLQKEAGEYPRADLVAVLNDQYAPLREQPLVGANIRALLSEDTFTVTTAHQPSLFLGPLYFVYKALTTIVLAETIQRKAVNRRRIVPVFVLGSEDHDLAELNHVNLFGKTLRWEPEEAGGPVGSMGTESLRPLLEDLQHLLGDSERARELYLRVAGAYLQQPTFAKATQALLHDLFGRYGLIVLDMNDARLKRHFVPVMRAELLQQVAHKLVGQTIERLGALGFKAQAAPREINLFYLLKDPTPALPRREGAGVGSFSRERIVREPDGCFRVLNSELVFTEKEILAELEEHPENFSPNVVLRPLYQEMILPNLAYVGGGGELAYWLERMALFQHFGVQFPMLVRRHSVLWLEREAVKKMGKLGLSPAQLFQDTDAIVRAYVEAHAEGEVDLGEEINKIKSLFERLAEKARSVDPTLEKAVLADATKAVGGLEQWQSRLVRAEKQKHEAGLNQIRTLKEKLFPGGGLQERSENFMPFYLKYGESFFDLLKENMEAFDPGFLVLQEELAA